MPDCNTIEGMELTVDGMDLIVGGDAKFYVRDMTMGKCMMFARLEGYSVKAECTAEYEHATIIVYEGSDCTGTLVLTQVMKNGDSSHDFSISLMSIVPGELTDVTATARISGMWGNHCAVHRPDCRFAYWAKFHCKTPDVAMANVFGDLLDVCERDFPMYSSPSRWLKRECERLANGTLIFKEYIYDLPYTADTCDTAELPMKINSYKSGKCYQDPKWNDRTHKRICPGAPWLKVLDFCGESLPTLEQMSKLENVMKAQARKQSAGLLGIGDDIPTVEVTACQQTVDNKDGKETVNNNDGRGVNIAIALNEQSDLEEADIVAASQQTKQQFLDYLLSTGNCSEVNDRDENVCGLLDALQGKGKWRLSESPTHSPSSSPSTASPTNQPSAEQAIGGDRDEHDCIGSAGYTWCEATSKCQRQWEEPCQSAPPTVRSALGSDDSWSWEHTLGICLFGFCTVGLLVLMVWAIYKLQENRSRQSKVRVRQHDVEADEDVEQGQRGETQIEMESAPNHRESIR